MSPESEVISCQEHKSISVTITPLSLSNLRSYITIRVPGIGDDLAKIPVTLESRVPKIVVDHPEQDLGYCFLRCTYKKSITLRNTSDSLPARFKIAEPDENTCKSAVYSCFPSSGIIEPNEELQLAIELRTEEIGPIHVSICIHTTGNAKVFHAITKYLTRSHSLLPLCLFTDSLGCPLPGSKLEPTFIAHSIGPTVSLQPIQSGLTDIGKIEATDDNDQISFENCIGVRDIDFGKINVLVEASKSCVLKNTSTIILEYKTLLESDDSPFSLENGHGKLEPGESVNLIIKVTPDDPTKLRDKLRVKIDHVEDIEIALCVQGFGSMVVCEELQGTYIDTKLPNQKAACIIYIF